MADEEQPFLGFDPDNDKTRSPAVSRVKEWLLRPNRSRQAVPMGLMILAIIAVFVILIERPRGVVLQRPESCDIIGGGYQCQPQISHFWGQYSPYFQVPSEISSDTPATCNITFAQILSRHGGRDPTFGKSVLYADTIDRIKRHEQNFSGDYAFLANYTYTMGADQLTGFGEQQMVNSGMDFFARYSNLAISAVPFVRASGQKRVIESAQKFTKGYHEARIAAGHSDDADYPYEILTISEAPGSNNTLGHGLCTAFEASNSSLVAQTAFASTFVPAISARLNVALPKANLTDRDTITLMDLCPFETVASPVGKPSQFCALFSQDEWRQYDYYQTLGKYYGYGPGNPLGPTQGVGYVNELIARLTGKAVVDHTSSNSSLDENIETFPLSRTFYADFGHDNDMTAVFGALGLYDVTPSLLTTELMTIEETQGYSAAWTVPFAARAIFEKMNCSGMKEEMVRVLVNGRVLPLEMCEADALGRCTLSQFVGSLSFARSGGRWDQCFANAELGIHNGLDHTTFGGDLEQTSR